MCHRGRNKEEVKNGKKKEKRVLHQAGRNKEEDEGIRDELSLEKEAVRRWRTEGGEGRGKEGREGEEEA